MYIFAELYISHIVAATASHSVGHRVPLALLCPHGLFNIAMNTGGSATHCWVAKHPPWGSECEWGRQKECAINSPFSTENAHKAVKDYNTCGRNLRNLVKV